MASFIVAIGLLCAPWVWVNQLGAILLSLTAWSVAIVPAATILYDLTHSAEMLYDIKVDHIQPVSSNRYSWMIKSLDRKDLRGPANRSFKTTITDPRYGLISVYTRKTTRFMIIFNALIAPRVPTLVKDAIHAIHHSYFGSNRENEGIHDTINVDLLDTLLMTYNTCGYNDFEDTKKHI